ncbi:MAG: carbon monoxide dehydrogenase subunit G [Novosphingobium sp.]
MKFTGQTSIAAPREKVWAALNDPLVLKACIPGCDSLEQTADGGFLAVVRQKIGPVSATFQGEVSIEEPQPPHRYRLVGKGSGGVAGFAKGEAIVTLTPIDAGTLLEYEAEALLGGKIAQLGGRLISGIAEKLAAEFFASFGRQVTGTDAVVVPSPSDSVGRKAVKPAMHANTGATGGTAGPGWPMFALAGWGTAGVLALLLLLERVVELYR